MVDFAKQLKLKLEQKETPVNVNTTPNFTSILDEAPSEVAKPKPLPEGTYLCVVGGPRYDKSSKKGTPFVEFILRPIAAEDDVDVDELDATGGFEGRNIFATYYLTETQKWRLDAFHEHCGLDLEEEASRRSRNDMVMNSQILAYVKHEPTEDGEEVRGKLSRTAPAE